MSLNCWEVLKCGREEGGEKAADLGVCAAFPDNGRDCWTVAGTLCGGELQGSYAQKIGNCRKCDFYKKVMMGDI